MSKIKQMLQLSRDGVSNRQIAKRLLISRDKVNEFVKAANEDPVGLPDLLKMEDPVLERRFHPGNPAYSDERMAIFLEHLPDFIEQLSHLVNSAHDHPENSQLFRRNTTQKEVLKG